MSPSIKSLYAYALAEGEGVGTAYEYYVKRRVLRSVLARTPRGGRVLVAGLPEKYGTSLDFVLAARERAASVLVVDDRPAAIERARAAFAPALGARAPAKERAGPAAVVVDYRLLESMRDVSSLEPHDLALSCEVLQRLDPDLRADYVAALRRIAPRGVLFCPNGENASHTKISGLEGLSLAEIARLAGPSCREAGFTDMPPFPPGITRSAEQRTRASSGLFEGAAMWGLQAYARAEPLVPAALKRRLAHIVYAKWEDRGAPGQ